MLRFALDVIPSYNNTVETTKVQQAPKNQNAQSSVDGFKPHECAAMFAAQKGEEGGEGKGEEHSARVVPELSARIPPSPIITPSFSGGTTLRVANTIVSRLPPPRNGHSARLMLPFSFCKLKPALYSGEATKGLGEEKAGCRS